MSDLFHIDGAIRDSYLNEMISPGISPCFWTFKNNHNPYGERTSVNQFYPFPSTFIDFAENDFGLKYSGNSDANIGFFSKIPSVKVRAYVPTTITNEVMNFLADALNSLAEGFSETANSNSLGEAAGKIGSFTKSSVVSTIKGIQNIFGSYSDAYENSNNMIEFIEKILRNVSIDFSGEKSSIILKLPYILYYALMGAKTNNCYEFPAVITSGFMDSDGTYGWNDRDNDISFGRMYSRGGIIKSTGVKFLNAFLGGFNVNFMPMFNPHHGNSDKSGCTIKIDLFNETRQQAIQNYKFIHALILNNMWIQYGWLQGPGSLYDVEIVGGNRFFMCSGDFKLEYVGTIRDAGNLKNELNLGESSQLLMPDAYRLTLNFKSLLPNNFNTFMIAKYAAKNQNKFSGDGFVPGGDMKSAGEDLFKHVEEYVRNSPDIPEEAGISDQAQFIESHLTN